MPTEAPAPDHADDVAGRVDPSEAYAIEQGCGKSAIPTAKVTLRQVITDQAGRLALLIAVDETTGTESAVVCAFDAPPTHYDAGFDRMDSYTGAVSLDFARGTSGGAMKDGKPLYAGQLGTDEVAGRVSPRVTRVTVRQGDESVDAMIDDGTYLARILHPSDWTIDGHGAPVIRAYDKNGTLLGEIGS